MLKLRSHNPEALLHHHIQLPLLCNALNKFRLLQPTSAHQNFCQGIDCNMHLLYSSSFNNNHGPTNNVGINGTYDTSCLLIVILVLFSSFPSLMFPGLPFTHH